MKRAPKDPKSGARRPSADPIRPTSDLLRGPISGSNQVRPPDHCTEVESFRIGTPRNCGVFWKTTDSDKSTCRETPTGSIHRLPLRTPPTPSRKARHRKSSQTGGRSKKLTKSLTAKTTKTRYRDPLRTLRTPRKRWEKRARSKSGEKKVSKVLDSKNQRD
jgi:hypothetical protein